MKRFSYKSLNGWLIPNINYFKALQEHALQMEQEIDRLQEQLAVSGSRALQERAEKWAVEWQQKCIQVGELQKQLIEVESQKDSEIMRLQYQVEYLEQQLDIYQKAEKPGKHTIQRARDPKTGRFNSVPASDKPFQAWLMHQQGYSNSQIAYKLGISADTVARYIRKQKAERKPPEEQTILYG